jgi:hypothetical protein
LHRTKIHFRAALTRSVAEEHQCNGEEQRDRQRQVAESLKRGFAKIDERHEHQHAQADEHALRVANDEHQVAEWIGARQHDGKADRGKEVRGGQQGAVPTNPETFPQQDDEVKRGEVQRGESERAVSKCIRRPHDQRRLQRGEIIRGQHGQSFRSGSAASRGTRTGSRQPLGISHESRRPLDRIRRHDGGRKRPHIGYLAVAPQRRHVIEERPGGEAAVGDVHEHGSERRFELLRVAEGVEVGGLRGARGRVAGHGTSTAAIRQSDRQHCDKRGEREENLPHG